MRTTRALGCACAQRGEQCTRQDSDPEVKPLKAATRAQSCVPFPRTGEGKLVIKPHGTHPSTARIPKS